MIDHARQSPENYGLPESPGEEDFKKLSDRIQSTGLNASDTPALVREQLNQQEQSGKDEEPKEEKEQEEDYSYGYGY